MGWQGKAQNCLNGYLINSYYMDSPHNNQEFCDKCGDPYPWAEKKINAAKEYVDFMEELSEEEKEDLKRNIDDIIFDIPRTKLASQKVKYYLSKTGKGMTVGLKNILIDFASETQKKYY